MRGIDAASIPTPTPEPNVQTPKNIPENEPPPKLQVSYKQWSVALVGSAGEWGRNNFNDFKDFRTENGSSQCQNLASTGVFVPSSLGSGLWKGGWMK